MTEPMPFRRQTTASMLREDIERRVAAAQAKTNSKIGIFRMTDGADIEEWLRSGQPCGDDPCRHQDARSRPCVAAAETVASLRRFVQFAADHSNDPAIVREAKRHGAK